MRTVLLLCCLVCVSGLVAQQEPEQQPNQENEKKDEELKPPTKKEIDRAVKKGVEWILKLQKPDGSFDGTYARSYPMGNTALCLLALLKSGVRRDHPAIQKGFSYALAQPLRKVYSVSIMIMALEAYYEPTEKELKKKKKKWRTTPAEMVAKRIKPRMRKWVLDAVDWLIKQQQANIWRYPTGGEDVSNTQYALLGLNAAMRMRIKIPPAVFKKAADYFLKYQGTSKEEFKPPFRVPAADFSIKQLKKLQKEYYKRLSEAAKTAKKPDKKAVENPRTELAEDPYRRFGVEESDFKMFPRGWQYTAPRARKPGEPPPAVRGTGSMTTAGLACLIICKAGLEGSRFWTKEYAKRVNQAIRDGAAWIAKYFTVEGNPYEDTTRAPSNSRWHYYYLYGLERAGILALVKFFGEHDWYLKGARYILKEQKPEGWWGGSVQTQKTSRGEQKRISPVDTCFALLFLKRATTPIVALPEKVIYTGEDVLGKPKKKEEDKKEPEKRPPEPQQGWKIGVVIEQTLLGVTVKQVLEDYPAKRAGIKEGDVILSVEGKEVKTLEEFREALRKATEVLKEVHIVVRREGERVELVIKKE